MKKKLFNLLTLVSVMLIGGANSAWAQTAISEDYTFIAQTAMNGNGVNSTSDLGGYIVCCSANNSAYAENKGKSVINGTEYYNCMQIKAQRGVIFKVASPCTMTIYGQVNGERTFILSKTDQTSGAIYTCPSSGGVYEIELDDNYINQNIYIIASGDLYLAGLSFSFAKAEVPDDDATIKSLTINGTVYNADADDNTSYSVLLPFATSAIPTIGVNTKNENAKVEITNPNTLPGTATIKVTAADNTTTAEYKVNYTLSDNALTSVMFSNGFDGFIKDNVVTAYYIEGTDAPEVSKITPVSEDGITTEVSDDKLIVKSTFATAEYTIETEAVTPYTDGDKTFDGTETWIKTGYSYSEERGWRFSKNVEEESNHRISNGSNRIYFFVGACKEITLATAKGITSARNIIVYRNGEKLTAPTQAPKYESGNTNSITIPGDPHAPSMIAVVSNQTGGDGGFGSFTKKDAISFNLTTEDTDFYSLYLDYAATIPAGVTAYTGVLNEEETTLTTTPVEGNVLPAGCAVLVKSDAAGEFTFEEAETEAPAVTANDLKGVTEETAAETLAEGKTVLTLGLLNGKTGFRNPANGKVQANKAYLLVNSVSAAKGIKIVPGGNTTGITEINAGNAVDNAPAYNVAGQRVTEAAKGLIIKNGKKFMNK